MSTEQRILLVEDDPEQAILFQNVLAIVGYDVAATDDAETALARLTERAFDLVLVDWDLPGMKGDAFITLVQQQYPATKTMLFSNHPDVDVAARACHADAWMVKNQGIKRLREVVASVLQPV